MQQKFGMAAVLLSALGLFGCNNLTGAEGVDVEGDDVTVDDPVAESNYAPAPNNIGCAYPTGGNVGVDVDMIVPASHQWEGYKAGEADPRMIPVTEFFDCEGSRQIDALILETSQYG